MLYFKWSSVSMKRCWIGPKLPDLKWKLVQQIDLDKMHWTKVMICFGRCHELETGEYCVKIP